MKAQPALSGSLLDTPTHAPEASVAVERDGYRSRFVAPVSARRRDAPLTGYLPACSPAFGGRLPGARLGHVRWFQAWPRLSLLPFLTREGNRAG
jgi:hypothetical protein